MGFYDLSWPRVLQEQGELARWAGVGAFCFYHYWLAGRRLLERPVEHILTSHGFRSEFCLCWANHSWTDHWGGRSEDILLAQTYPGREDDWAHYQYLRPFFEDSRYFRVKGRPFFAVFHPEQLPERSRFSADFKAWCRRDGLEEPFLVGLSDDERLLHDGFDALAPHSLNVALRNYLRGSTRLLHAFRHRVLRFPCVAISYQKLSRFFENHTCDGVRKIPTVVPNWDNTPRIGRRGLVLTGCTPETFREHLRVSLAGLQPALDDNGELVLIKSWNEWAEGNYLEPDLRWGRAFLEVLRSFPKAPAPQRRAHAQGAACQGR